MAPLAGTKSQEYWRPPNPEVMRLVDPTSTAAACWRCGTTYSPGARFCHICGSEREPLFTTPTNEHESHAKSIRLDDLRQRGLSIASPLFFLIGLACIIAAVLTGFIYKAQTLVEWQAVQIWRVEWLLAAAAALLAGILLRQK